MSDTASALRRCLLCWFSVELFNNSSAVTALAPLYLELPGCLACSFCCLLLMYCLPPACCCMSAVYLTTAWMVSCCATPAHVSCLAANPNVYPSTLHSSWHNSGLLILSCRHATWLLTLCCTRRLITHSRWTTYFRVATGRRKSSPPSRALADIPVACC
jgi:hypothetical protein